MRPFLRPCLIGLVVVLGACGCEEKKSDPNPEKPLAPLGGGNPAAPKQTNVALPVKLTCRESSWGEGLVLIAKNQSSKHLRVRLSWYSSGGRHLWSEYWNLKPNGKSERGWFEGLRFATDDQVILTHDDFAPVGGRLQ